MKKLLCIALSTVMLVSSLASCAQVKPSSRITSSAGLESYADFLESRLGENLPDSVYLGLPDEVADMTGFENDGYITRASGGDLVIYGKTAEGVDRAVRDYVKNGNPERYEKTYHEGYRVKKLTVNGRDISEYKIVKPADCNEFAYFAKPKDANVSMDFAASELQSYINKTCGAVLEITTDTAVSPAIRLQIGDLEKYGNEAFSIEVGENDVVITGGRYRGCMYGVYDFLEEDVGWRFFQDPYGQYREHLYENDEVDITEKSDRFEKANFNFRTSRSNARTGTYGRNIENIRYKRKISPLYADGAMDLGFIREAGHGLVNNKFVIENDPSMAGQPCFTDEGVLQQIVDQAVALARKNVNELGMIPGYDFTQIDVGQRDTPSFCLCDGCRRMFEKEESNAGAVVRMTNRVAEAVHEEYPEIVINMLAYYGSNKAPKHAVPAENVKVSFCFYVRPNNDGIQCSNHMIFDENCLTNAKNLKDLMGWLKICDFIDTWYYPFNFYDAAAQSPFFSNIYDDIMYLRNLGVYGINRDGNDGDGARLMSLVQDVYSKLIWEEWTKEDYFEYIREWFNLNYGDAGDILYELLIMNERASDKSSCWCSFFGSSQDKISEGYIRQRYGEQVELLDHALSLADTAEEELFINLYSTGFLYMIVGYMYDDLYVKGTADEKAWISELYERMYSILKENNIPIYLNSKNKYVPEALDLDKNPFTWMKDN